MLQTTPDDRIKSVHVLTTGTGAQHPEHRYGSKMPSLWWVLTSKKWIKVPTNVFVIEHRDGLVLFDTGIDLAVSTDPNYIDSAIGRFFLRKLFKFHIGPEDTLTTQLKKLGYDAKDVDKVVVSHLHFDHVGCIMEVPQAELLVSKDEWSQLSEPHPERDFILKEHIEIPNAKWHQIEWAKTDDPLLTGFDGCFDVMGDGSLVALSTPGHTKGSLSLLIRSSGKAPILLVGDLTYEADLLMNNQVPGTGDKEKLLSSFAKVQDLKEKLPELVILPSHDPAVPEALKALDKEGSTT
ncbi:MAG: N-acyl homoserine lactonase family protein [Rhodospirillales bacterium]|nr:N-acyl homoserine lactonase family protein [Rhodospirillales bacterium]